MRMSLLNVHPTRLIPSGEQELICACTVWCNLKHICRSIEVFLCTRLLGQCLKHWINDAMVTVDCRMPFSPLKVFVMSLFFRNSWRVFS